MAIVASRQRFCFSGFFMVEEASGILTLNRKRQIGYMHGPRSEVDRLISVRQSVTLYADELGEETNGAVCFRPVFI